MVIDLFHNSKIERSNI